jgi:hypothetical protein
MKERSLFNAALDKNNKYLNIDAIKADVLASLLLLFYISLIIDLLIACFHEFPTSLFMLITIRNGLYNRTRE